LSLAPQRIHMIDSHTGGEPTRVVTAGGPDLGRGSLFERLERFRVDFDWFRSAVVNEPRGSDAVVGALLCEPSDPVSVAGVIFFNNVGYLGMCGHGTIGLVVTLAYMGRIAPGVHKIETPVGTVSAQLHTSGAVTVHNVASYRYRAAVSVDVPGHGRIIGDVAWGGNWFFLVKEHGLKLSLDNIEQLTEFTWAVRKSLSAAGITGERGAEIDHVELFGPPDYKDADSKNFVLCPGKAYDRSPCGTGSSAKAACLYADGKLRPGEVWRQESIVGSVFEVSVAVDGTKVAPSITGTAFVTAEGDLILQENDPFRRGIQANRVREPAVTAGH